jgi:hypothetical protein
MGIPNGRKVNGAGNVISKYAANRQNRYSTRKLLGAMSHFIIPNSGSDNTSDGTENVY